MSTLHSKARRELRFCWRLLNLQIKNKKTRIRIGRCNKEKEMREKSTNPWKSVSRSVCRTSFPILLFYYFILRFYSILFHSFLPQLYTKQRKNLTFFPVELPSLCGALLYYWKLFEFLLPAFSLYYKWIQPKQQQEQLRQQLNNGNSGIRRIETAAASKLDLDRLVVISSGMGGIVNFC